MGNPSAHVEALPGADLVTPRAAAATQKRRSERAIDAFLALYEARGSLSEEMPSR
jgi:hypothetical protein